MFKTKTILAGLAGAAFCVSSARAEGFGEWFGNTVDDAKMVWKDPQAKDFYLPLYAWHNRLTYDREHIDSYNENPWGLGFGAARKDKNGNEDRLVAMGFDDSNNHFMTVWGYAWLKNFAKSDNGDWAFSAGWEASLVQRQEYAYIPVPLPLPVASLSYKGFALEGTYIPGLRNDGNVLFLWGKYRFNYRTFNSFPLNSPS